MSDRLLIKTKCLKDFLSLFENEKTFDSLTLGDTWHPSAGFVDESILKGKNRVSDILSFNYDFKGLVGFEAKIGSISIKLLTYPNESRDLEEYEISGTKPELRNIYNKAIEQNAYHPNKYQFHFMSEWE